MTPKRWAVGILAVIVTVAATNWLYAGRPVSSALGADSRNEVFTIRAHLRFYVNPTSLVLDLRKVEEPGVAPVELMRGIIQTAEAFSSRRRKFNKVTLSRRGNAVYELSGEDYYELGIESAVGQNPLYMVRTFPEKLYLTDGRPAFGRWTGGILGVTSEQMSDVTEAMHTWVSGGDRLFGEN